MHSTYRWTCPACTRSFNVHNDVPEPVLCPNCQKDATERERSLEPPPQPPAPQPFPPMTVSPRESQDAFLDVLRPHVGAFIGINYRRAAACEPAMLVNVTADHFTVRSADTALLYHFPLRMVLSAVEAEGGRMSLRGHVLTAGVQPRRAGVSSDSLQGSTRSRWGILRHSNTSATTYWPRPVAGARAR